MRRSCREIGGLGWPARSRRERSAIRRGGKFWPGIFGWMLHVQPFERDPKDIPGQTN